MSFQHAHLWMDANSASPLLTFIHKVTYNSNPSVQLRSWELRALFKYPIVVYWQCWDLNLSLALNLILGTRQSEQSSILDSAVQEFLHHAERPLSLSHNYLNENKWEARRNTFCLDFRFIYTASRPVDSERMHTKICGIRAKKKFILHWITFPGNQKIH